MDTKTGNRQKLGAASKFSSKQVTETIATAVIEQRWHWKGNTNLGIWDLDVHPNCEKLLTAGDDGKAMVWEVVPDTKQTGEGLRIDVEFVSCLSSSNVSSGCNAAKWSPTGDVIATGYDGGIAYLWRRSSKQKQIFDSDALYNKEHWVPFKSLRQLKSNDISALAWAPDHSTITGTTSGGKTVVWDVQSGTIRQVFDEHQYRGCGLALNPFGHDFVTVADDQRMCFYDENKLVKMQPSDVSRGLVDQDKLRSVVRRPAWSPDGMWLVVPTAYQKVMRPQGHKHAKRKLVEDEDDEEEDPLANFIELHGCQLYLKGKYDKPIAFLPSSSGFTPISVAFSPSFYELSGTAEKGLGASIWGDLPYRMVFAVAMRHRSSRSSCVQVYDTAHTTPLFEVHNAHTMAVTNLAWSPSGGRLWACSRDGYVSVVEINTEVLGKPVANKAAAAILAGILSARGHLAQKASKVLAILKTNTRDAQQRRKDCIRTQKESKDKDREKTDKDKENTQGAVAVPQVKSKKRICPTVVAN